MDEKREEFRATPYFSSFDDWVDGSTAVQMANTGQVPLPCPHGSLRTSMHF